MPNPISNSTAEHDAAQGRLPALSVTVPGQCACTVVITSKNRKQELQDAIASCLTQDLPLEVLVIDDASTDGTPDMVRELFPQIRYLRDQVSRGYIVQRNRAALLARTNLIVSIDDDATFPAPDIISHSLRELDHPRVGALAIPYIDIYKTDGVRQLAPDSTEPYAIPAYVGTAHIVRRDLFVQLGKYREIHLHQGEEGDFALRMLHAGYIVRAGTATPIRHLESPKRDFSRLFENNARNHILYAWHNIPMPHLTLRMLGMTLNLLRWGLKKQHLRSTLRGLWRGYRDMLMGRLDPRRPVSSQTYALSRRLYKLSPLPLSLIRPSITPSPDLPPLYAHSPSRSSAASA
ncbi:MAG: glycosyltransferase family 2 protein [Phycisphaerales bacterium]